MSKLTLAAGPEHLKAIGAITVNFAHLELVVEGLISELLLPNDQRAGQIVCAEMSFQRLLHLMVSLYRHRESDQEKIKVIESLQKRAAEVEQERNAVTHSFWAAGNTRETITRVKITAKARKGWNMKSLQMSVADLESLAERISALSYDILMFTFNLKPRPILTAGEDGGFDLSKGRMPKTEVT